MMEVWKKPNCPFSIYILNVILHQTCIKASEVETCYKWIGPAGEELICWKCVCLSSNRSCTHLWVIRSGHRSGHWQASRNLTNQKSLKPNLQFSGRASSFAFFLCHSEIITGHKAVQSGWIGAYYGFLNNAQIKLSPFFTLRHITRSIFLLYQNYVLNNHLNYLSVSLADAGGVQKKKIFLYFFQAKWSIIISGSQCMFACPWLNSICQRTMA